METFIHIPGVMGAMGDTEAPEVSDINHFFSSIALNKFKLKI